MKLPTPQAGSAPQNGGTAGLAASAVIATGRAVLLRASMLNTNAALRYLQVFNAAALPAEGAVPVLSIPVAIGGFESLDLGVYGKFFPAGISMCSSSTAGIKTISAADAVIEATYVQG